MKRVEIVKKAERVMASAVTSGQIKVAMDYVGLAIKRVEPIVTPGTWDLQYTLLQGRLTGLLNQGCSKLNLLARVEIAELTKILQRGIGRKKRRALIKKVKRLGFLPGGGR